MDHPRVVERTTASTIVNKHRAWRYFPIFLFVSVGWDRVRPQEVDQETMGTWFLEAV